MPFMTDRSKRSKEILKKLSRRKLLRDSAITAAGAVLLPSLITGCDKSDNDNGGLGGPEGGWIGGFAQSNPAFAYPDPDLTSLPLLDNMDNIDLLDRQQAALWPEFSWESQKGSPDPER